MCLSEYLRLKGIIVCICLYNIRIIRIQVYFYVIIEIIKKYNQRHNTVRVILLLLPLSLFALSYFL